MRGFAIALPLLLLLASAGQAERLYKWVDDDGEVHYSDSIPPEEARKRREREVKSDSGQTVDVIEPPPTEAEIEARKQAEREARERAERERRAAERDRALLKMFSSVEEIREARRERIEAVDAQISVTRARLDKLRARLEERQAEAARLERSGRGDPAPVYREIAELESVIDGHERYIQRQEAEKTRIRERFARDLARFRSLTQARGD